MRLFNVNPRTFIAIGHDIVVAALVWTFTFSLRWNFELDRSTQIILRARRRRRRQRRGQD